VAGLAGQALRERPAWFLLAPTWSIESDAVADKLRGLAVLHRRQSPHHRLIFVGNTPREVGLLQARGEAAFFFNKTALTSERLFRPLDALTPDFEAIYNAQLLFWKRHELTLEIPRCAFLFYRDPSRDEDARAAEATIMARHAAVAPNHVFINRFGADGVPTRLSPGQVNRHLNRARIGLCLSKKEGAMFASMEYLLAGLPVVTTPSTGGRDVYYDPEYCWTVSPDARAVADAVRALAGRAIPRASIHRRTLDRVEADRARFLGLINAIREECSAPALASTWPFHKPVTMEWLLIDDAVGRAVSGMVDGFDAEERRLFRWPHWRQLLRRLKRRIEGVP
jgi:glycosyltransferase involved in cell wall biosynthesis